MKKLNIFYLGLLVCLVYVGVVNLGIFQKKKPLKMENNLSISHSNNASALLLIGAGNVGYPLLHALALDKKSFSMFSKIIILDAQPKKLDEIQFAQQHIPVEYIQGDMRNEHVLSHIFQQANIKGVIILAAVSRVMWCELEKETCKEINTHAIQKLMNQITLSKSDPWIIFASSREVYGGVKEFPITETTPMNPLNLYGQTKMKSEEILTTYNKKPLHRIILRFSSIYGGKYDHSDRLIPSMIRSMLNDQPIPFSGTNQEFDFTYIDDVVDAIKLAIHKAVSMTSDIGSLSKYNICSGELTSVQRLYHLIKYITNSQSPAIFFESSGVFPDKYQASSKFAQEHLGFKASVSILNGLMAYIQRIYLLSHQQLQQKLTHSTSFNEEDAIKSLDDCTVVFEFNNQLKIPPHSSQVTVKVNEHNHLVIPSLDSGPKEFIVKVDSYSRSLVLLDTQDTSKYYEMDKKTLTSWNNKTFPYKIHIHCCPKVANHPFSTFSPYFLSNFDYSQRPTHQTSQNEKLQQAIKYTHQQLSNIRQMEILEVNPKFENITLSITSSSTTMDPNEWKQLTKEPCESDCNNAITCLKRSTCRCVINEQCSHSSMTLPPFISSSPLYDQRMSLLSVYGRSLGKKWPKIYVHDFSEMKSYLSHKNCGKTLYGTSCCFTMDAVLYYSFKSISVPIDQADIVMLPHFQGCAIHYNGDSSGNQINGYILKELENLKSKYPNKIFTSMASHDYGGCDSFWWSYFEANYPKQRLGYSKMVSIQPNGDFFSKCYIPEKDIVAPPRTCLTNRLVEKFGKESSVKKVTERKHLVFFEGSLFGTGEVTRRTLKECPNVFGFLPKNQYSDYLEMLSETKFCPLVAGTTGWATRNSDVIYAGCIPVYISEYTHQPFANLLDYSKFSLKIHPSEVYNLKSILESVSEESMLEMQRNLLLVRDLMVYKNEDTVQEWSPQDMVLRELYIKFKTRFEKNSLE